jgi:hypothetical protein
MLNPLTMIAPWGVTVIGVFTPDRGVLVMLVTTLCLAYGQLMLATDTVRLYQWAAPAMILATMTVATPVWAVVALIVHLSNPWAGDGA